MRLIETGIPEQVQNTEALLYDISNHLSGVKGCRKVEYEVTIANHGGSTMIQLNPAGVPIVVWGRGKDATRLDALYHVLTYHLLLYPVSVMNDGYWSIPKSMFVNGKYKYTLSKTGRTRHWQTI